MTKRRQNLARLQDPPEDPGPARPARPEWRYRRKTPTREAFPDWDPEANRQPRCVYCGGDLPDRRLRWCSDWCVRYAQIRCGQSGAIRHALLRRDRAVCQLCGLDTAALEQAFRSARRDLEGRITRAYNRQYDRMAPDWSTGGPIWERQTERWARARLRLGLAGRRLHHQLLIRLEALGFAAAAHGNRSFWEADHIVPVSEGGGFCGLENLRTVCQPCHRAETAALAGRLAAARDPRTDFNREES